jgi:hypothetical protein
MGSRKSTLSMDTVTQGQPECRMAETPAARSTMDKTTPPKTFPWLFTWWGIMSSETRASD